MKRKNKKILSHQQSTKENDISMQINPSPSKKAENLVKTGNSKQIKKQLTFSYALSDELKKKLKDNASTRKKKKSLRDMVSGKYLKKYRLLKKAEEDLAVSREYMRAKMNRLYKRLAMNRNTVSRKVPEDVCKAVEEFYNRDDISRPASGKKETITRKKEWAQAISM